MQYFSLAVLGLAATPAFAAVVQRSTGISEMLAKRQSSTCRAGVETINGKQFTIQCGVDRAGESVLKYDSFPA
jgi:hypothetical protein